MLQQLLILIMGAYEKKNSAFFGKGLAFAKYTGARGKSGCNDANAEFVAWQCNG